MTEHSQIKSKGLLIKGGRIIDPFQDIDAVGDILIAEGTIALVSTRQSSPIEPRPGQDDVLSAHGMIVCPGFVDLHCHLRQPGFEEKETIATGTMAAARGGFTTICCMPNTNPPLDSRSTVSHLKKKAAREGLVRVLPIACVTLGRQGKEATDFPDLASSGVVAFSDDGSPVSDSNIMRHALEFSARSGLPIIDHCEDLSITGNGVINEGRVASRLGLIGIPARSEESMVARDIELARSTGGRIHIAHASTAGSVELIRKAKEQGVKITAEATPHHLTLTEDAALGCDTNAKVSPPLRTTEDARALVRGLRDGVIDAVATDHAPHTLKDKQCDFYSAAFGISGLETALGSLMSLVHNGDIDLGTLISKLTVEPARVINSDAGTLRPGAPADITIFDPDREWVVNPSGFASKGKNTPLAGRTLRGKVVATIVEGRIIHLDSPKKEPATSKTGASIG